MACIGAERCHMTWVKCAESMIVLGHFNNAVSGVGSLDLLPPCYRHSCIDG